MTCVPDPTACLLLRDEKAPTSIALSNAFYLSPPSFLTALPLCSRVSSFYYEIPGALITIGEIPRGC